jgi:hypothetical protein
MLFYAEFGAERSGKTDEPSQCLSYEGNLAHG